MSTPNGYNNPAYCHQYDSSLYDYQYVPEIDPDSPDLSEDSNRRGNQKLVHPIFSNIQNQFSESDEFEGSDESNRSIIIEECNNRRVTLICEKRSKTEVTNGEFYQDGNFGGAYYQDISLESESGCDVQGNKTLLKSKGIRSEDKSLRHKRPLEPPPVEEPRRHDDVRRFSRAESGDRRLGPSSSFKQSTTSINSFQRPQRFHRYEEIPSDENHDCSNSSVKPSVHRYAEISPDENGYPTLKKEIKVEESREFHPLNGQPKENYSSKVIRKPRAISPVNYPKSFSPPLTPNRTNLRTSSSNEFSPSRFTPKSPSPIIYCSSPLKTNSFEMSDLSPPHSSDSKYFVNEQTFFIHSPKRQPPIGASALNDMQEPYSSNGRCILPTNLQKLSSKSGKERSHSAPNSPKKRKDLSQIYTDPGKSTSEKKITHIFHIRPVKSNQTKLKSNFGGKIFSERENNTARRNISNSFTDPSKGSSTPQRECIRSPKMLTRSPYKPTTVEIVPPKTAIITPTFQRKNHVEQNEMAYSPRRNFEKMSQAFQSTGNLYQSRRDHVYPYQSDLQFNPGQEKLISPRKMKRNQSVPNFQQSFAENEIAGKREIFSQENRKRSTNLDFQYSPTKKLEHAIDKSRLSLIDQTSSWSNLEADPRSQCSICFIFAAIVHLVTATATCAISFYLLSKVGRKYYLDFGILAGFVNFILGLLGFRSYCWRWLPNRNYVSGFIGLAAFSAFTCAGLSYIITARPMAGNPILDIMGGAICAVSVLTIFLALTGLTMSGCCKSPPPDNRVTNV